MALKNRYIKSQIEYSWFNVGKSGKQRKRNKRLGTHIIRQKQKLELKIIRSDYNV